MWSDHTDTSKTVTDVVTETAYIIEGPAPTGDVPIATVTASPTSPTQVSQDTWKDAMSSAAAAAATLYPSCPQSVNQGDVGNLNPSTNASLSFLPPGLNPSTANEPYAFAEANVTYQYPTVILPHSNLVSSLECEPYGLQIGFSDETAYDFVESHWTTNNGEGFLLVTTSLSCNAADQGLHVYWLVDSLSYNDANMTVFVTAKEVGTEDAYGEVSRPSALLPTPLTHASFRSRSSGVPLSLRVAAAAAATMVVLVLATAAPVSALEVPEATVIPARAALAAVVPAPVPAVAARVLAPMATQAQAAMALRLVPDPALARRRALVQAPRAPHRARPPTTATAPLSTQATSPVLTRQPATRDSPRHRVAKTLTMFSMRKSDTSATWIPRTSPI